MPLTGTSYQTYNAVPPNINALKPSVFDKIVLVGATDTPLLQLLKKSVITNPTHSWLVDQIPEPENKPRAELAELGKGQPSTVQKTENHCQICINEILLSKSAIASQEYGGQNAWDREKGKYAKAHALNLEWNLWGVHDTQQVKTSVFDAPVKRAIGGADPVSAGWFYYLAKEEQNFNNGWRGNIRACDDAGDWTGTKEPFNLKLFMELLQKCWEKGATPKDAFMGGSLLASLISLRKDLGHTTIMHDNGLKTQVSTIYTDFGNIRLHGHRQLNKTNGLDDVMLIGDFDYAEHCVLIDTVFEEVPVNLTAKAGSFRTESCLAVRNADAFVMAVGLDSAVTLNNP